MNPEAKSALLTNLLKATETRFEKHLEADEAYITELRQLLARSMGLPQVAPEEVVP